MHSENDRGVRTRIKALEKLIGRLEVAQTRLVQSLERDDDPGGAMFRRIRERMNELERQRLAKIDELRSLQVREARHEPGSVDLLEELPVDDGIMKSPPEPILRWLFEAFRLEVRYDKVAGWADCSVTIQEETVDHLSAKQLPVFADEVAGERSLLVGAPGRAPARREQARPGVSRGVLVISGGFELPKSPWAR